MPQTNPLNLDAGHNSAICAEIGERLRFLLPKEQLPPHIQHLLDRLSTLDETGSSPKIIGH
jgi:hypothetical protein